MNDHWPTLQTKINIAIMGLLSILFLVPAFAAEDVETIESEQLLALQKMQEIFQDQSLLFQMKI